MSDNTICGHEYEVVSPRIVHIKDKKKAGTRVIIRHITKADGSPIRFKSKERAERHIRNMRLEA